VLLITSHDIGRHLGCYGVATVHTPALDRLAREGVCFDRAYCPSPFCSPSRAAIFTGRCPHSTGVNGLAHGGFGWDLNDDEVHLARYLADAGYRCEQFGTMHETHRPANRWGYAQHHVDPQGTASEIADIACRRIHDMARSSAVDGARAPWYFHIGFFEPHKPFDWGGATPDDSSGVTVPPWLVGSPAARQRFAAFQGAIRNLNEGVERVLAALDASGQAENTLVLFTADHGIPFPRAKGSLYEAGLEVALLVRWPARGWVGGRRPSELISHIDHTPTILDAVGIPRPARVEGRSYRALLDGEAFEANSQVFAELTFFNTPSYNPRRGVRCDRYRLILNATTDQPFREEPGLTPIAEALTPWSGALANGDAPLLELYDMIEDPLQLKNLAQSPAHAAVLSDLTARLWKWMNATADPLLCGVPTPPAQKRALAVLGDPPRRQREGEQGSR
jgi:arylsulfatase A-like enzyme